MARRATRLRSLLLCPQCGHGLFPANSDLTLAFYCQNGHEMAVEDVLRAQSASVRTSLEIVLAEWELQQQALLATAEDARKHGLLEVAEIFLRRAKNLDSRIEKVRNASSHSESSAVLTVPEGLRSAEPMA